jgi:hypothetical protein
MITVNAADTWKAALTHSPYYIPAVFSCSLALLSQPNCKYPISYLAVVFSSPLLSPPSLPRLSQITLLNLKPSYNLQGLFGSASVGVEIRLAKLSFLSLIPAQYLPSSLQLARSARAAQLSANGPFVAMQQCAQAVGASRLLRPPPPHLVRGNDVLGCQ